MIEYPVVFLYIWITSFLFHELMHGFEAFRQGAHNMVIYLDFKYLSLCIDYHGVVSNTRLVTIAGGLYTSMVLFLLCMFSSGAWLFSFLTLGWIHIVYGVFEYRYHHMFSEEQFRNGRYCIYCFVLLCCVISWWWIF